jgi:hypothetical protein
MTNEQLLEVFQPLIETEFKYRDWVDFATELGFDSSFEAYESFCAFVEETTE